MLNSASAGTTLRILNSNGRQKTIFPPIIPEKKRITCYTCGPTVYDSPHLGHARSAVSLDILRRILRDYSNYTVKFVMNVRDVDDKIVLKGRHAYLGTRL